MADHGTVIIKKKKVHGGHGHHGGSWKVAYADFVTAMMAFFMVMWIMGLSDQTKAQIQGYFNDPMGFMKNQPRSKNIFNVKSFPAASPQTKQVGSPGAGERSGGSESQVTAQAAEGAELERRIGKAIAEAPNLKALLKYIDFTITREGIRMEFVESTGSVFFESGSAKIRPEAKRLIKLITPVLRASGRGMIIEGHTDAKPYGGKEYTNFELSSDRANALRRMFSYSGIPDNRFLGVRGMADRDLKNPLNPLDLKNRRVTVLLPWNTGDSGVTELPKDGLKKNTEAEFKAKLNNTPPPVVIKPREP